MPEPTCGTCARYEDTGDGLGYCSRYDCETPAAFLDEWGYCWEAREQKEGERDGAIAKPAV